MDFEKPSFTKKRKIEFKQCPEDGDARATMLESKEVKLVLLFAIVWISSAYWLPGEMDSKIYTMQETCDYAVRKVPPRRNDNPLKVLVENSMELWGQKRLTGHGLRSGHYWCLTLNYPWNPGYKNHCEAALKFLFISLLKELCASITSGMKLPGFILNRLTNYFCLSSFWALAVDWHGNNNFFFRVSIVLEMYPGWYVIL